MKKGVDRFRLFLYIYTPRATRKHDAEVAKKKKRKKAKKMLDNRWSVRYNSQGRCARRSN